MRRVTAGAVEKNFGGVVVATTARADVSPATTKFDLKPLNYHLFVDLRWYARASIARIHTINNLIITLFTYLQLTAPARAHVVHTVKYPRS